MAIDMIRDRERMATMLGCGQVRVSVNLGGCTSPMLAEIAALYVAALPGWIVAADSFGVPVRIPATEGRVYEDSAEAIGAAVSALLNDVRGAL